MSDCDSNDGRQRGIGVLAALLSATPWLFPFAGGPLATVQPWLAGFVCGVVLWIAASLQGAELRWRWCSAALGLLAWIAVTSSPARVELAACAGGLALICIAASLADVPSVRRGALAGLLIAAIASALLALLQYVGAGASLAPWVSAASAGEAYANLRQPNHLATLCTLGVAVVLWGPWSLRREARLGLVFLLATASAAAASRTALVQLLALFMLAVLWRSEGRRERISISLVALGAHIIASALLPMLLSWLGATPQRSLWDRFGGGVGCGSRAVLWSNVLHLIASKPLAGWGLGELDYAHFTTLYEGPRFCDILDNAHNLPLHIAVELGIPAALTFTGALVWWVARKSPWHDTAAHRQLAWAMLAAIAIHSFLEYPLWYAPFQLVAGFALGLASPREVQPGRRRGAMRAIPAAVGVVLLFAAAAAAWDYSRVSQIYLPPDQRRVGWRDDPLKAAKASWLFAPVGDFAALTLAAPRRDNAEWMYDTSLRLLHYSPEPRVVERAIEAATCLGRDAEAAALLARYRAAFPREAQAFLRRRAAGDQG